jgi:hypothetical protein
MPRHWMQAPTNYILEISYTYVKDFECRHQLHSLQFMQLQEYSCTRDSRDGFGEEDPGAVCELVEDSTQEAYWHIIYEGESYHA